MQLVRTVRIIPQQNDVVERLNRTLLKIVSYLPLNSHLPKYFWEKAFQIASHLIKKSPASAINIKTPNEVSFGKTFGYGYLRVFDAWHLFISMRENCILEQRNTYYLDLVMVSRDISSSVLILEFSVWLTRN